MLVHPRVKQMRNVYNVHSLLSLLLRIQLHAADFRCERVKLGGPGDLVRRQRRPRGLDGLGLVPVEPNERSALSVKHASV